MNILNLRYTFPNGKLIGYDKSQLDCILRLMHERSIFNIDMVYTIKQGIQGIKKLVNIDTICNKLLKYIVIFIDFNVIVSNIYSLILNCILYFIDTFG